MRTLKFKKHENGRVELIMRINNNYYGIWFPMKFGFTCNDFSTEYFEIVPIKSAQELINES